MSQSNAPFDIKAGFGTFALGYGALWLILISMVEFGAGDLAAALALLIASGATVVGMQTALGNLRLGGSGNGGT